MVARLLLTDFITLVQIGADDERPAYEIEDGKILLNDTECKIKYIFRNEVVPSYDALLTQGISAHCAWAFAYPLAKSQALRDGAQQYMKDILQIGRTRNGQQKQSESMGDELLLRSRLP